MIEHGFNTLPDIAANDEGADWFIVRIAPRAERRVMVHLHELKIPAYLPCEVQWRRRRNRKLRVKFPLLPGYAFVKLDLNERGEPIGVFDVCTTNGVTGMVGEHFPRAVDWASLMRLHTAERAGEFDHTPAEKAPLVVGQTVKIIRGKFQGILAQIAKPMDGDRYRIEMSGIFSGGLTVEADYLEAA